MSRPFFFFFFLFLALWYCSKTQAYFKFPLALRYCSKTQAFYLKKIKNSFGLCGNVQKAKSIFNFFWPIVGPILALWYSLNAQAFSFSALVALFLAHSWPYIWPLRHSLKTQPNPKKKKMMKRIKVKLMEVPPINLRGGLRG
jgi:hypothetical protein